MEIPLGIPTLRVRTRVVVVSFHYQWTPRTQLPTHIVVCDVPPLLIYQLRIHVRKKPSHRPCRVVLRVVHHGRDAARLAHAPHLVEGRVAAQQRFVARLWLGGQRGGADPGVADGFQRVLGCEGRVYDLDDHRRDHVCFGDVEALDVVQPGVEFEAAHHVGQEAAAERRGVCARHVGDVEHWRAEQTDDVVVARLVLEHHGVLRDEVVVRHLDGFGEPRCTAAEQPCCCCAFASRLVVPAYPVAFSVTQQIPPALDAAPALFASQAFTPYFAVGPGLGNGGLVVEDENVRTWDPGLLGCFQGIGKKFGFDEEGFDFGGLESVCEFVCSM